MQEYRQLNGFGAGLESIFLISKKGKVTFKQKRTDSTPKAEDNHNRKKQYLLEEKEKSFLPLSIWGFLRQKARS